LLVKAGERDECPVVRTEIIEKLNAEQFAADVNVDGENGHGQENGPPGGAEADRHRGS